MLKIIKKKADDHLVISFDRKQREVIVRGGNTQIRLPVNEATSFIKQQLIEVFYFSDTIDRINLLEIYKSPIIEIYKRVKRNNDNFIIIIKKNKIIQDYLPTWIFGRL